MTIADCPFCGAVCVLRNTRARYWVACTDETDCEVTSPYGDTAEQAIEAHNRVANLRAENERLKKSLEDLINASDLDPYPEGYELTELNKARVACKKVLRGETT